jgi:hypothetical protein
VALLCVGEKWRGIRGEVTVKPTGVVTSFLSQIFLSYWHVFSFFLGRLVAGWRSNGILKKVDDSSAITKSWEDKVKKSGRNT